MHFPGLRYATSVLLPLCCLLLLVTGCAGMRGLKEKPRVSVADIRVQDIKAMETVLILQLRILNPNDIPIELNGVSCEMEVDGRHFASGITDTNQTVPAFGTALVPVSVYASVLDMVSSVAGLIHSANATANSKPMAYVLKGNVIAGVGGFSKELPFSVSGDLSLKGLERGIKLPK
jgi:LEA14-like dessication related protein